MNLILRALAWLIAATERAHQRHALVVLDGYEPGCSDHAYCHALGRALEGHAVAVLVGIGPSGGAATFSVWRPASPEQCRFLMHDDLNVRAATVIGYAIAARATAVDRGVLAG